MEHIINYKCGADETHATWSGYEGKVPTQCPVCEADGVITGEQSGNAAVDANPGAGMVAGADLGAEGGDKTVVDEGADMVVSHGDGAEKATYLITGLVDRFDEQHQIVGQYPVGSEQELSVAEGDRAVEAGQATKVE